MSALFLREKRKYDIDCRISPLFNTDIHVLRWFGILR